MRVLKDMLCIQKPKLLGLLEPRVSGVHTDVICKKIGFDNWIRVEAVGFNGGIWIFWGNEYDVHIVYTHPQFVVLKINNGREEPWLLAVVYGGSNVGLRQRLWNDLVPNRIGFKGPLLTVGDFIAVTSNEEVTSQGPLIHSRCAGFRKWIFDLGLIDIGYIGLTFT